MNRGKEVEALADRIRELLHRESNLNVSSSATAVGNGMMFVVSRGDLLDGKKDVQYFDMIILPRGRS